VHLKGGEVVQARRVVANVPPGALARLRIDRCVRERFADRDAWGAFVLHLGIDASGIEPMHPFHQVIPDVLAEPHDGGNVFVSIYPGRGSRANRWSISASTHTRAAGWYRGDIEQRRAALEERMLRAIEQVIPCARSRALVVRSATPRTFERFTMRPGGYVGGFVQRPSRVALRAAPHRPEPGLFLAGDHVFPGQGTVGVALSGINAYRDAVESFGRRPQL
jgi:phytoene dehydrogenase-like protein